MDSNFAVWSQSKIMYTMERSLVLTPVSALVNIAKAAFHAMQAVGKSGEEKGALKQRAWSELKHGVKTLLPVIGFVPVALHIYKTNKAVKPSNSQETQEIKPEKPVKPKKKETPEEQPEQNQVVSNQNQADSNQTKVEPKITLKDRVNSRFASFRKSMIDLWNK